MVLAYNGCKSILVYLPTEGGLESCYAFKPVLRRRPNFSDFDSEFDSGSEKSECRDGYFRVGPSVPGGLRHGIESVYYIDCSALVQ